MIHAVLTGRTVMAGPGPDDLDLGLHILAREASRGGDYLHVDLPQGQNARGLDPHVVRPAIPPEAEWDGLPPLTATGAEAAGCSYGFTPEAVQHAYARQDAAWAGRVPGPGQRLANRGPGAPPHPALAADLAPPTTGPAIPWPLLDVAGLDGRIVSVGRLRGLTLASTYFAWLALGAAERAERAGGTPPVFVGDPTNLLVLSRLLGWPVVEDGEYAACLPPRDPALLAMRAEVEAMREAAADLAMSGCASTHAGGLWRAEGGGRTTFAIRQPWSRESETENAILFVAVDPGPRVHCRLHKWTERASDATVSHLCRRAWLVGPDALDGIDSTRTPENPLTKVWAEFIAAPGLTRLRSELAALIGPGWAEFHRVIGRSSKQAELTAWVHDTDGHPERRRQFVVSYPALRRLAGDRGVTKAVDAGRSPVPRLREILRVREWALRRLSAGPFLPGGREEADAIPWRYHGAILEAIGPDRVPNDHLGWFWLSQRSESLDYLLPTRDDRVAYAPYVARLVAGRPPMRWRGMGEGVPYGPRHRDMVRDFLRALTRWLAAVTGGAEIPALAAAAEYGSLPALWDAARRWHADPRLANRVTGVPNDATWPVPFAPVDLGDGWSAVPIGSVAALVDEGRSGPDEDGMEGLRHCVATYASDCYTGRCAIVSIRETRDGRTGRASTASLYFTVGEPPSLGQHQGIGNADPPEGAASAFARLLAGIASGGIPLSPQAYQRRDLPDISGLPTGLDLLPAWRRILPQRWARCDVAAMAADLGRARAA